MQVKKVRAGAHRSTAPRLGGGRSSV